MGEVAWLLGFREARVEGAESRLALRQQHGGRVLGRKIVALKLAKHFYEGSLDDLA